MQITKTISNTINNTVSLMNIINIILLNNNLSRKNTPDFVIHRFV